MMFRPFLLFLLLLFTASTCLLGQAPPLTEVIAKEGDGIYTILRRNGLEPGDHIKKFLDLNKGSIGKDSSLFIGRTYLLPTISNQNTDITTGAVVHSAPAEGTGIESLPETSVIEFPAFGENYSRVEIKDQQLKGAIYYLTSGHGGPDPGAIGKYGPYHLGEDEYAYDVTLRLARSLMEHGATVYLIIQDPDDGIRESNILELDTDEVCYPGEEIPYDHGDRLRQRTQAINNLYISHKGAYQRMLAIHVDSRGKGQNIDVFFYHHKNSPSGKKLAESIQQTITSKYNQYQPNREYLGSVTDRSGLYVVKYSHPPTVFVELGNIRNGRDQRRFVLPDNRQALANWMCEGIIADYKSTK